jgi:5-oxoprolinase (ATP-hydrolysing) subunit C
MSLRVLEPGLCSLIVDAGRPRTRSLGVPCGGAADRSALALGNALLGNPPDAAALEMTLAGPVIQALEPTGAIILGAPFSLGSARQPPQANTSFTLEAGEELHVGGTRHGARAYLCVVGGFQMPLILGSRCSLAPVRRGDVLACSDSTARRRAIHYSFAWPQMPALSHHLHEQGRTLRVLPGPEADWFPLEGRELYEPSSRVFTVRPESNRMGLRLSGEAISMPPREMVSQPVAPGALQVSRDGQLILLGVDGQTIGGYPRIGHVISSDLDLVGQLRPGDHVTFHPVGLAEAERLNRQTRTLLEQWQVRLGEAAKAF